METRVGFVVSYNNNGHERVFALEMRPDPSFVDNKTLNFSNRNRPN